MNTQKVIITFMLLFTFVYIKGQDRIITTQQDTIICKIVSISHVRITYVQEVDDNPKTESKFIQMRQVQEYSLNPQEQKSFSSSPDTMQITEAPHNVLNTSQIAKNLPALLDTMQVAETFPAPSNKKQTEKSIFDFLNRKREIKPFYRWRFEFQGGGSYLINSLPGLRQALKDLGLFPESQANDYYKQLRKGMNIGVDVHYLITDFWGVGINYSLFTSSAQKDFIIKGNSPEIPTYLCMGEKDKMFVNYIGPSFILQQWLGDDHKFQLSEEISIGYARYRNETQFDPDQNVVMNPDLHKYVFNLLREGNTWGGNFKLSIEYYPISWLSIGADAEIFSAVFHSLRISDNETSIVKHLDKRNYLDMSRVDFSIGLCFHFNINSNSK